MVDFVVYGVVVDVLLGTDVPGGQERMSDSLEIEWKVLWDAWYVCWEMNPVLLKEYLVFFTIEPFPDSDLVALYYFWCLFAVSINVRNWEDKGFWQKAFPHETMPTFYFYHCPQDSYEASSRWLDAEVLQHLEMYMLIELLKTLYNLMKIEALSDCMGGVTVLWKLILKPWELMHKMISISRYNVHCFRQLCYLSWFIRTLQEW